MANGVSEHNLFFGVSYGDKCLSMTSKPEYSGGALEVQLFTTEDDEPWGLWATGHHPKVEFLLKANEVIAELDYAPVTIDQVEHGHAYYDSGLPEFNLMEAEQGQPGAFPITWVRGDKITYPSE